MLILALLFVLRGATFSHIKVWEFAVVWFAFLFLVPDPEKGFWIR